MHLVRTPDELASLCKPSTDTDLQELLGGYVAALEEFEGRLQATMLVVYANDSLSSVEQACGDRLVADGAFTFPVEIITRHGTWFNVVWIMSDDGSGLVLMIEIADQTDTELLMACENALAAATP